MKISCPQCDAEYDLPNVTRDILQNNVQCSRCHHQFLPDGGRSQETGDAVKPARRIVILPSAKFEELLLKNNQGRPDLLKKAQWLVSNQQDDAKNGNIPKPTIDGELPNLDDDKSNIDDELKIKNLSDEAFDFVSLNNEDKISEERRPIFRDK